MKYFTRGWATGEHDEKESERMRAAYWRRIEALRAAMPASVLELATATELHDGLLDRIVWQQADHRLELELVCGTDPPGYLAVHLAYSGVRIAADTVDSLAACVRDRRTEILYDEIDQDVDGAWIHRILFAPVGEVSLWFSSLEIRRARRADKRFATAGCDPFVAVY